VIKNVNGLDYGTTSTTGKQDDTLTEDSNIGFNTECERNLTKKEQEIITKIFPSPHSSKKITDMDDEELNKFSIEFDLNDLAETIMCVCPNSRERSLALTKLEECMFWANASIARN
jgi:hypothetical protein